MHASIAELQGASFGPMTDSPLLVTLAFCWWSSLLYDNAYRFISVDDFSRVLLKGDEFDSIIVGAGIVARCVACAGNL
jgi:hypothetical protein